MIDRHSCACKSLAIASASILRAARLLIADLMQLPMMPAAERHRELIADFETDCPGLGKPQVMRIARLPAADQAWLRSSEFQMRLVAQPLRFSEGELALVDPIGDGAIEQCRRERWAAVGLISLPILSFGKGAFCPEPVTPSWL